MDAELAGKPFSLEIENDLGKTTYEFDLALDDQPPSGKWFLKNCVLNIWLFFFQKTALLLISVLNE